jgi:hypothetical protein
MTWYDMEDYSAKGCQEHLTWDLHAIGLRDACNALDRDSKLSASRSFEVQVPEKERAAR